MKPVRTTARIGIDQRCLQVVFAQKPGERAPCRLSATPRRHSHATRQGRRKSLPHASTGCWSNASGICTNPAEAFGADGPEASGWRGLQRHEPAQRSQAGLDVCRRVGRQARLNQRLRKARIVVGEHVFEPEPVFAFALHETAPSTGRPRALRMPLAKGLRDFSAQ